ncbi:hypothetical protein GCM10008966_23430 [Rhodovulum strictum]
MRPRIGQRGLGNRLAQGLGRGLHRGGLADIDQRPVIGKRHPCNQRRASITGGAKVVAMRGFSGRGMDQAPR